MWTEEELVPSVAKLLSQWDRGLWTRQQALDNLLSNLAFTLFAHPESRSVVSEVIDTLPFSVASDVLDWMSERRSPNGWVWPPIGAIGSPCGKTVFRLASPAEVAVYDALEEFLRGHVARATPSSEE